MKANSCSWLPSLQIYPYEALIVTHRGRCKLPPGVDRTRLEVCARDAKNESIFAQKKEHFKPFLSSDVIKADFFLLSSEASLPRGVWAGVRDADGRVWPPLFVEKKRTKEEGLAFLTGGGLSVPPAPLRYVLHVGEKQAVTSDIIKDTEPWLISPITSEDAWRPCGSELAPLNPLLWLTLTDALTLILPVLHL